MPLCVVSPNVIHMRATHYFLDEDKYIGYDAPQLVLVYNSVDYYTSCEKIETPRNFTSHHIDKVDKLLNEAKAAAWKLVAEVGEEQMGPVLCDLQETIQTFKDIQKKAADTKGKKWQNIKG